MAGEPLPPSPWVLRHAGLVPPGRPVLDLACGSGRHSLVFLGGGHPVTAVDRDLSGMRRGPAGPAALDRSETGAPWPFAAGSCGVVVTNYLHRPILADSWRQWGPAAPDLRDLCGRQWASASQQSGSCCSRASCWRVRGHLKSPGHRIVSQPASENQRLAAVHDA
jgi:hypothetical protein